MSRLLKKCLFLSIGLHILLAAMLIFCTAFFVAKPEKIMPTLSMIAPDVLDNLINPQRVSTPKPIPQPPVRRIVTPTPPRKVTPTPPRKLTPTPPRKLTPTPPRKVTPTPPRKVTPTPPKKETHPSKPSKRKANLKPERKPIKIAKNTQTTEGAIARTQNNQPKSPSVNAKDLKNIKNLRTQLSAAINVNVTGANKAAFTSYANFVVGVYRRTWEPLIPSGLARSRIAKVSVIIRRDGRVLSAKITNKTGDAALDRSVQHALDSVKRIGKPFPSGSKDSKRTFMLDFTPRIRGGN
jgi:outer membrane biosynthesis protein TonB